MKIVIFLLGILFFGAELIAAECVVVLHGLARTENSMQKMATALEREDFAVANVSYPSRSHSIEMLSELAVGRGLARCPQASAKIHFVTHSLGGILVRYYLSNRVIENLGRVVMLAPPNQGSEVVDNFRDLPGYKMLNGPAGLELGTDLASVPKNLGPVGFELGVIAGEKSVNPILSLSLPGPNDGKVSVAGTKVEGIKDFIVLPHSHPFIMNAADTIIQTIAFLKNGAFVHGEDKPTDADHNAPGNT